MKRSLVDRLERHSAAMAAVAMGAAFGGAASTADGQIVYSGQVNIPIPATTEGLFIDLVTGDQTAYSATYDLNFWGTTGATIWFGSYYSVPLGAGVSSSAGGTDVLALAAGTLIDASSLYSAYSVSSAAFSNTDPRLLGLHFVRESDNTNHYAWVRWQRAGDDGTPGVLIDYAYESQPDVGIIAGAASNNATGPCCRTDGTCTPSQTPAACQALGGQFSIAADCASAACPAPGSCCKIDGTCQTGLQPAGCSALGGVFGGAGVSCAAANCPAAAACCLTDGTCTQLTAAGCATHAGFIDGAATCAAANCPHTYVTTSVPVSIDDNTCTASTAYAEFTVAGAFTVQEADVAFYLPHTYQSDLRVALQHVDTGTTVFVLDRTGNGSDNFGTPAIPFRTLDQAATVYGTPAFANVSGDWKPVNPLAPFNGESSAGTWRLLLQDCAGADTGTLISAVLSLRGPAGPPPCYPNCDASTQAPVLNIGDFTCFLQKFASGSPYANCDNSTQAPVLNIADFTCFLKAFAAGCP